MKQKINTKSSTEAELVGADDVMDFVVWTKLSLEWQMRKHDDKEKTKLIGQKVILEQDNTASIRLERFSKTSSTKCTHHLQIRYFYVTSSHDEGLITVVTYKPILDMTSDYLTKPLQGSQFRKHCNIILGITEEEETEAHSAYKARRMM